MSLQIIQSIDGLLQLSKADIYWRWPRFRYVVDYLKLSYSPMHHIITEVLTYKKARLDGCHNVDACVPDNFLYVGYVHISSWLWTLRSYHQFSHTNFICLLCYLLTATPSCTELVTPKTNFKMSNFSACSSRSRNLFDANTLCAFKFHFNAATLGTCLCYQTA